MNKMNKKYSKYPPGLPLKFFRWFCHPEYVEDIEGDLLERFEKKPSKWRFTIEILKLLRPSLIKPASGGTKLNYYGMLKHYFLVTVRGFNKEKSYAITNLLGLTLSISVCLMIWQFIENEQAVDSLHLNAANKYRMNYSYYAGEALQTETATNTSAVGPEVSQNFAGIKNMVRVRPLFSDEGLVVINQSKSKKFIEYGIQYVEDSFLDMFNYPLAKGSRKDALSDPNSIVLTAKTAEKLFGADESLGKTVIIKGGTLTGEFIVTGVLSEFPVGTHLDFDYLVPIDFMLSNYGLYQRSDGWQWQNIRTYFELEEQTRITELTARIDELLAARLSKSLEETNQTLQTSLQPISNIYLDPFMDGDAGLNKGNAENLNVFSLVSLMILIIAGINYVNLASARSFRKRQEVQIRKAIGAHRNQLIFQFIFDAFLFNAIAFLLALFITIISASSLQQLIGLEVQLTLINTTEFWIIAGVSLVGVSLVTGIYPALLAIKLSGATGKSKSNDGTSRGVFFQRSLIAFQLVVSLLMVAGTFLVYHQINFMKNKELGIDMEKLFIVHGPRVVIEEGRDIMKVKQDRFKNTLLDHSDISTVGVSSNVPGTGSIFSGGLRKLGDPRNKEIGTEAILVGHDFSNTYDLEFLAGGPFSEGMKDYEAAIINEKALSALGFSKPHEALNQRVVLEDMDTTRIHGVIKDIHWNSLHAKVAPTIFWINDFPAFLSIKLNTKNLSTSLELIEDTFHELYPNDPYVSFFLDDEFNIQYESEQQFAKLFSIFSVVAIIISGLGLLALIVYALSQKMKEIGIRKVLGATTTQLFQLLSREYLLIFLLALGVAIPLIYWGAYRWLQDYAYRINLGLELFLLPALMVGIITAMVIGRKVFMATQLNPVDQLRDE